MSDLNRQQLRDQLKAKRLNLSTSERARASLQICDSSCQLTDFKKAQHIAIYLSHQGEVETVGIIEQARNLQKKLYLPVLHPEKPGFLSFVLFKPDAPLIKNRFGILEPAFNPADIIGPNQLDIIFLPLVAFDPQGNRLGTGAGFYDRSLADVHQPTLIGLAYEFQNQPLYAQSWDVPMNLVITEKKIYVCRDSQNGLV